MFFFLPGEFLFHNVKKNKKKKMFFILLMIICPGYSSWIKKIMGKKISKIIQEIFFFPSGKYILQIFFFQWRIFLSFYEKSISLDFFFHFSTKRIRKNSRVSENSVNLGKNKKKQKIQGICFSSIFVFFADLVSHLKKIIILKPMWKIMRANLFFHLFASHEHNRNEWITRKEK